MLNYKSLHASIDLETLSKEPDAAIISIGLVLFELNPKGSVIHRRSLCDVNHNTIPSHRMVDLKTLEWWKSIGPMPQGGLSYYEMLSYVAEDLENVKYLWGHGKDFDIVKLHQSYKAMNMPAPKCIENFWDTMDTRTHFTLADFDYTSWRSDVILDNQRHKALVDAELQARGIMIAYHKGKAAQFFGRR